MDLILLKVVQTSLGWSSCAVAWTPAFPILKRQWWKPDAESTRWATPYAPIGRRLPDGSRQRHRQHGSCRSGGLLVNLGRQYRRGGVFLTLVAPGTLSTRAGSGSGLRIINQPRKASPCLQHGLDGTVKPRWRTYPKQLHLGRRRHQTHDVGSFGRGASAGISNHTVQSLPALIQG